MPEYHDFLIVAYLLSFLIVNGLVKHFFMVGFFDAIPSQKNKLIGFFAVTYQLWAVLLSFLITKYLIAPILDIVIGVIN